jgi:aryl-alcohol dehydrogenase-like predicted oxidoreductase
MMHRGADLAGTRGKHLADTLGNWCAKNGLTFGASCYEPGETAELARNRGIRLTQLPGNALDQRVAQAGTALEGVEVHLRSAFLQGLLLLPLAQASARLPRAASALQLWHTHCERRGLAPLETALGVVRSFAAVDVVVVGVDSLAQWREIARAWERAEPCSASEIACMDATVIDPRLWAIKT